MRRRRGQSIVEYTMIIGIVTVVLYFMGTGIKRGVQSLVRVTADQVGNQQQADQDFNDAQSGYMNQSNSQLQDAKNRQVYEQGYFDQTGNAVYVRSTDLNETSVTMTNTITNGGFTPNQ